MPTLKHIAKYLFILLIVYFLYSTVSILVYTKIKMNQTSVIVQEMPVKSMDDILIPNQTNELAAVSSKIENVLPLRCQLIDQAQESLLICQYTIADDDSGLIFIGKLLEAAERGVKIELLVNGLSNQVKGFQRLPLSLLASHPNFELKMVGGFNFLKPWQMNNVLHDKLMIVDDNYLLSSGGNIENRFTVVADNPRPVHDLDVVIQRNGDVSKDSLITQGTDYFNQLWENPYAVDLLDKAKINGEHLSEKDIAENKNNIAAAFTRQKSLIGKEVLEQMTFHPIASSHLVHNSVGTLVKEPVVWKQLTTLINQSEHNTTISSPYVVITDKMKDYITVPSHGQIDILSNSVNNSPNLFAFGGYLNQKEKLLEIFNIWEYQGQGSLHQKAVLIDDTIGIVGSFNMDSRSTFLSSEHMLIINSQGFHDELNNIINDYKEHSLPSVMGKENNEDASSTSALKKGLLKVISWISPLIEFLL
ncbi:phospholipase D-like domain-containing protein [Vagococcus elongatus]|uniref:phospholipase D-like domain-containing protein n=1 Tax=Vagococcus elongatus TaxID=180344 RepID=UPI000F86A99B|nr:phospholipase D-like domain-containing protein [Vagococcus elongatus]